MKKKDLGFLSKHRHSIIVLVLCALSSIVWGVVSAQNYNSAVPLPPTNLTAANTAASTSTNTAINTNTAAVPAAPTEFRKEGDSSTSIYLKWKDNSVNEDRFHLERKLSGVADAQYIIFAEVGSNNPYYADTNAVLGHAFDYRVQACLQGAGCSDYAYLSGVFNSHSNTGGTPNTAQNATTTNTGTSTPNMTNNDSNTSLNTASDTSTANPVTTPNSAATNNTAPTPTTAPNIANIIPATPTNLKKEGSTLTSIYLRWTDNSINEDQFNLQRKLSSAPDAYFGPLAQLGSNSTYYVDMTAISGYAYDYRIQSCVYGTGCSAFSYLIGVSNNGISTNVNNANAVNNTTVTPNTTPAIVPPPAATHLDTPNSGPNTIPVIPSNTNVSGKITVPSVTAKPNTPTTKPSQEKSADTVKVPTATVPVSNTTPEPPKTPETTETTETTATSPEPNTAVVAATTLPAKIDDLGRAVLERKTKIDYAKGQLTKVIDQNIANITKESSASGQKIDTDKVNALRGELLNKIDNNLSSLTNITPADVEGLKQEVNKGIGNIRSAAGGNISAPEIGTPLVDVSGTLNTLSTAINDKSDALQKQGADLLYKDTNKDGISDYDSIYVYKIDPNKPSPVSTYEGKPINAAEKVLLGFDPSKSEIVKVGREQPVESKAAVVSTYKVETVALTEKKEVVFKGKALPNSFVTIYIYSTPIMVTVKTNSEGEWQYVMDKELENGDHTVYTATVNNSGNIVAKSSPFLFTKTAEAATLKSSPLAAADTAYAYKPGLLENSNFYIITVAGILVIAIILTVIGVSSRKKEEL